MADAGMGSPTRKTHPASVTQDGALSGQQGIGASDTPDIAITVPDGSIAPIVMAPANPVPTNARSERMAINRRRSVQAIE